MLTLNDGRSELWQWDTGRTLAVDADCSQVHFSNKVFGRSIDVDVAGGVAIIPDVLLQTDKDLNVWAFVGTAESGYTKISKTFKVNRRNKPAGYVFTPTEQTTIAEIAAIAQSVRDDADAGRFDGAQGPAGPVGPVGPKGDTGDTGPAGVGVPNGGIAGQLLSKTESGTEWIDPPQSGGGGSVPKPLTYDYMPEGYPSKSVQTTTLMEEQQVAFTSVGSKGFYAAQITNAFEIVEGQTYTVNWDGAEYECVGVISDSTLLLGNLRIAVGGANTGELFAYGYNIKQSLGQFVTLDTSASHTISVKTTAETITPMAFDYMPEGYPTKRVHNTTPMEEQEVAFTLNEKYSLYMAQLTNAFDVVKGQKYTINWDGTEYECVGIAMAPEYALGNTSVTGEGSDTGEPFMYVYNTEQHSGMFVTRDTAASHTISVKGIEETVTPMATEFLPSEVDELIMNSSTPGSAKKFKITVNDSGTISATEVI